MTIRHFGVTERPTLGQPSASPHTAQNTRADTVLPPASRQPANLPDSGQVFSSSDKEFAALCFSFGALVGLPLVILSFVVGLLVSFG